MSAISVSIGVSKNVNQNVQNEGTNPARKTRHLLGDGDCLATSGVSEFSHPEKFDQPEKWTQHPSFSGEW